MTAREVSVFYRSERARLEAVIFWDGDRRLKTLKPGHRMQEDFSRVADSRNTWTLRRSLGVGFGISLQFIFSVTGTVTVMGARVLFERRGPT